ncbi:hypothetical protein GCM10011297_16910 [Bacterioplanes sanyensis]|uniref:hypothetical protein n=1 Tax=Bacterioplanes sanyensis TaxID=1249553 RepID=UPI001672AD6E|nr:hypothetical protein [Bacterioplanes sanyensis]GGY44563.1 hypothetical protein GCM10011297_16910 [Bacterioplanes sanyensis]
MKIWLLPVLLLTFSAQAQPSHIIHAGLIRATGDAEHDFFGISNHSDLDVYGFSLAHSFYFNRTDNQLQTTLSRRNLVFNDSQEHGHLWGLDIDWKVTLGHYRLKPYVSAGMGYQQHSAHQEKDFFDDDLSGININVGAGMILDKDNWRFDLGYQRKAVWSNANLALFFDSETRLDELSFSIGRLF